MRAAIESSLLISWQRVRELFVYREDGWLERAVGGRKHAASYRGRFIGSGYLALSVDSRTYYVHRLVWFYHRAVWPSHVDHIDGCKTNNRIENLRECTAAQNQHNTTAKSCSQSGLKGVFPAGSEGKWLSLIVLDGKQKYLGTFTDKVAAARAYDKVAIAYFGEFAKPNFSEQ